MDMRKRSSRPDPNRNARSIVDETAKVEPSAEPTPPAGALYNPVSIPGEPVPTDPAKNPAAVALGKLGGRKGGPARAKALSAKRRAEIARAAAKARWQNK